MQITALGYALIGLVRAEPRSGYALRKVFEDTPMGSFSSSPGSIYPALKKLADAGMLEKRGAESGRKPVFHITPLGESTMRAWLELPVTSDELAHAVDRVLLRFAFLQDIQDLRVTRRFLTSFETALGTHIEGLEIYLDSPDGRSLSRHGRLAVENGLRGFRAHLDWVADALEEFGS